MEIVSIIFGFIIGVIIAGVAIELSIRRSSSQAPASKHTKKWSISEISNPKIMAEYLSKDVEIPKSSKLLVNKCKDKTVLSGLNAREHKGIKGNFIVGDDRALILAGPVKGDELGFWTVEKDIVEKLNREFDEMWLEGAKLEKEEK
jgi:hypothetical protein